jgi:hypothetical protein
MRALAATLRGRAAAVAVVAAEVDARMNAAEFVGPAADRLRETVDGSGRRCAALGHRLLDVANLLERSASEVEAAQAERARVIKDLLAAQAGPGGN